MTDPELTESSVDPWLLLIHQLPPQPAYFRVKIWRRLQGLGAVAIKNAVYALPAGDQAQEDFEWVLREIREGGGDGSICEARFLDGLGDDEIRAMFQAARDADYEQIAAEARGLAAQSDSLPQGHDTAAPAGRLRRRLGQIGAIDFFDAPGRIAAEAAIAALEARMQHEDSNGADAGPGARDLLPVQGATWVTRKDVHIDRIASAWLIRRFIDPEARFVFVPARGYRPKPGELRFDMFDAEFTHEGDRCTFEVLLERAPLSDQALRQMAEIVHDIDFKDAKYDRPEAAGIDRLITGIVLAHAEDEVRITRASTVFDDLLEYFSRKRRAGSGGRPGKPA